MNINVIQVSTDADFDALEALTDDTFSPTELNVTLDFRGLSFFEVCKHIYGSIDFIMYMHIYIYKHICIYIYTCMHIHIYIHIYMSIYIYTYHFFH
jgi:hypothetical protein